MSSRKRKYDKDYLKFRFAKAMDKGQVVPKCVLCGNFEQRYFKTKSLSEPFTSKISWPTRQELRIFEAKEESFKTMKIGNSDTFGEYSCAETVEA